MRSRVSASLPKVSATSSAVALRAASAEVGGVEKAYDALSKDHTALDPKERKRIEASGGFVEGGRVTC